MKCSVSKLAADALTRSRLAYRCIWLTAAATSVLATVLVCYAQCISAPRQAKPAGGDDLKGSHGTPRPESTRVVVVQTRMRGSLQGGGAEYVKRAMTSKGTA